MALNSRLPARTRTGPQRPKVNGDENAVINKHVKQPSVVGPLRVPNKTGPQRPALGEVTAIAVNKQVQKAIGKVFKDETGLKRGRSASLAAATGPQRIPLGPVKVIANATSTATTVKVDLPNSGPLRPQRPTSMRQSETAPELHKPTPVIVPEEVEDSEDESMDIEQDDVLAKEVEAMVEEHDELNDDEKEPDPVPVAHIWPELSSEAAARYRHEIERIQATFHDEVDMFDTTMVSEYAEEIFEYMEKLEMDMMPSPNYMDSQSEITWDMRQTLVDWLLQVHLRYHLLPETLWIAVNIIDRFLSKRIVSVLKLQLVGVTAMFIAAKYEEILAPSADEFVYMTEKGYTREEILKGERVVLQTLDFKVSDYCSPYSWMRRISKADDYDIQTRTLCKFLVEVTLLDHRFLRVKPSLVAAVGMYTSRSMLGGNWNDAFVFYSGYAEEQLIPGHHFILEKLLENGFDDQYVAKKYSNKKFLKASLYAVQWAKDRQAALIAQAQKEKETEKEDMALCA